MCATSNEEVGQDRASPSGPGDFGLRLRLSSLTYHRGYARSSFLVSLQTCLAKSFILFLDNALVFPFIFLGVRAQASEITIYQNQRALIKEEASFPLKAGISTTAPLPVPWGFEPSSVLISPARSKRKASVLEQDFFGGWKNQSQILEKFVGKEVRLKENKPSETVKGVLLEARDNLTALKVQNRVYLNPKGTWILPLPLTPFQKGGKHARPSALTAPSSPKAGFKPAVSWKMKAESSGNYPFEISYLTGDITWEASYAAVIDESSSLMDLRVWANLRNQSGMDFKKARVLLVAGNPHQSSPARHSGPMFRTLAAPSQQTIEKDQNLFEYHLYPLPDAVNLKEGRLRISMGEAFGVPVEKKYLYDASDLSGDFSVYTRVNPDYGADGKGEVEVIFKLNNSKAAHLGFPLPPGEIRMYQKDKSGSLEWVGSDFLPATPRNEKVLINAGRAFDVLGSRARLQFESGPKNARESFEITLTNRKKSDVLVSVVADLYSWSQWKIISSDQKWKKKDARTIVFEIPVKKNSSSKINYAVEYYWK
jgi:hypothetical protein